MEKRRDTSFRVLAGTKTVISKAYLGEIKKRPDGYPSFRAHGGFSHHSMMRDDPIDMLGYTDERSVVGTRAGGGFVTAILLPRLCPNALQIYFEYAYVEKKEDGSPSRSKIFGCFTMPASPALWCKGKKPKILSIMR